jgi:hypothetical protein
MNRRYPLLLLVAVFLGGCAEQEPEGPGKTIGGQAGESYRQMLEQTADGVDQLNQQMRDQDERMQELRQ